MKHQQRPQSRSLAYQFVAIVISCVWLLAVYKVFILDDGIEYEKKNGHKEEIQHIPIVNERIYTHDSKPKVIHKSFKKSSIDGNVVANKHASLSQKAPSSADWLALRDNFAATEKPVTSNDFNDGSNKADKLIVDNTNLKPNYELQWPPVLPDGSIDPSDGIEIMPITKMKVPRFWEASPGTDLNTVGKKVNGYETIFLMIASYRDFQCRETIASAYLRADHPERLFIAAVDQVVPGDIGCLDNAVPCSEDPEQPLCKYRNQISVYKMDAQYATGPVTARHIGDRMYRGEYFVMQMDAHCLFIRHWDTKIIDQWRSTNNEMAVLSSYLTDVQGSISPTFDSNRNTRPIMCNSDFEGEMPARYLRHLSQPEDIPAIREMPQLQPFWAAGFSFSRGHFKVRVPYDAYQPMVFQGEEISIGIRGFTHGYDFYAPRDSVVFHEYAEMSKRRKKIHMFWENSEQHKGEGKKSLRRSTSIIGMAPDIDPATWDHSELDKYGLGKVRDLQLFYKLFLIDPVGRHTVQLCPFVNTGKMHKDFQPYIRHDHNGIDYSYLLEYNTQDALKIQSGNIRNYHPYWQRKLEHAMDVRNKELLQKAIQEAESIDAGEESPSLLMRAKELLKVL